MTIYFIFSCIALATAEDLTKRLLFQVNSGVAVGDVTSGDITEASGLCASRRHPGILYTHNDRGNHNRIYAINSTTAHVEAVITINAVRNKDWEDVACGKCVGHMTDFCVYIGDIGDNGGHGSARKVYRIQEPEVLSASMAVDVEGTLHFTWREIDAETLMITPDAELYIISKVDGGHGIIASLPSAGWTGTVAAHDINTHLDVHSTHPDPVGGDMSPDGQEVLVKTREQVLHFSMNGNTDYLNVLASKPLSLPYIHEKHGESVAFSVDGRHYFTLAEGHHPTLYRFDAV